jgi:hypothetical protein
MHPDVDWADAREGGRVVGGAAVGDYWTRQFSLVTSRVEPERFTEEPDVTHPIQGMRAVLSRSEGFWTLIERFSIRRRRCWLDSSADLQ